MRNLHIISSDWHVPFHNKALTKGMIDLIKDLEPKLSGFYLLGDFMDMNSLSFHDKGKMPIKGITLESEFKSGNKVLDRLDRVLGDRVDKFYLGGNHCSRYDRHAETPDGAKMGDLINPYIQLDLEDRGYEIKTDWKEDYFKLGKYLELMHGQFLNVHTAKKHLDVFRTSVIFGHSHRLQMFTEGNMAAFNIGHMADETTEAFNYQSRSMKKLHLNGFAIVTIDNDGYFYVNLISAFNNKFYYNGKKYGG